MNFRHVLCFACQKQSECGYYLWCMAFDAGRQRQQLCTLMLCLKKGWLKVCVCVCKKKNERGVCLCVGGKILTGQCRKGVGSDNKKDSIELSETDWEGKCWHARFLSFIQLRPIALSISLSLALSAFFNALQCWLHGPQTLAPHSALPLSHLSPWSPDGGTASEGWIKRTTEGGSGGSYWNRWSK